MWALTLLISLQQRCLIYVTLTHCPLHLPCLVQTRLSHVRFGMQRGIPMC